MSACEAFEEDLVLYLEGELKDPGRASRIRLHLGLCEGCREWAAVYDEFTRSILEAEPIESEEVSSSESWDTPRPGHGRSFTDRVMSSVRGIETQRRSARLRRLAATLAVFLGLAAGGGAYYLRERSAGTMDPSADLAMAPAAVSGPSASPPAFVSNITVAAPPGQHQGPADLNSAWWVIDPERETERARARRIEARFFGRSESEASARENRQYLMLNALLGGDLSDLLDQERAFRFVMVPEGGGREGTIPVRPVALPVEVDERELAPPALTRLKAPTRRYRLVLIGNDGFGVRLGPSGMPSAPDVPASLNSPASSPYIPPGGTLVPSSHIRPEGTLRSRIPLELLPLAPERQ